MLRARDLLSDLEKVALHPALKEEWRVVFDLNVGVVEALKLKQPVLVALFIARRLGEATASEKAGAIRTAHAQLKELKAMGKGRVRGTRQMDYLPPGHGLVWGAPPGPAHTPTTPATVSEGGGVPMASVTSAAHTWEGRTVAGEGTSAAAWGTTAPRTGGSTENAGGGVAAESAGAAAAEALRSSGSVPSRVRLPLTTLIRCAHWTNALSAASRATSASSAQIDDAQQRPVVRGWGANCTIVGSEIRT